MDKRGSVWEWTEKILEDGENTRKRHVVKTGFLGLAGGLNWKQLAAQA